MSIEETKQNGQNRRRHGDEQEKAQLEQVKYQVQSKLGESKTMKSVV